MSYTFFRPRCGMHMLNVKLSNRQGKGCGATKSDQKLFSDIVMGTFRGKKIDTQNQPPPPRFANTRDGGGADCSSCKKESAPLDLNRTQC